MNRATQRLEEFAKEHGFTIDYGDEEFDYPSVQMCDDLKVTDLVDEVRLAWLSGLPADRKVELLLRAEKEGLMSFFMAVDHPLVELLPTLEEYADRREDRQPGSVLHGLHANGIEILAMDHEGFLFSFQKDSPAATALILWLAHLKQFMTIGQLLMPLDKLFSDLKAKLAISCPPKGVVQ